MDGLKRSLKTEFIKHSTDYLQLLSRKARKASNNETQKEEFSIMEYFYDGTEALINNFEEDLHLCKLERLQFVLRSNMLEKELEESMRQVFSMSPKLKPKPKFHQWKGIKAKHKNGEVSIAQIMDHFLISDEQVKELFS